MLEKKTVLVSILDRSGSMSGLEESSISGFNKFIKEQRSVEGEVEVNTVLFDDSIEVIHNELPIAHVPLLTTRDYFARGSTALLDAIGQAIHKIETRIKFEKGMSNSDKVIFLIVTDGQENASRHYSYEIIRKLITTHVKKDQWEFIYLGANMDAVQEASKYGIRKERAMNFTATQDGINHVYETINSFATHIRQTQQFNTSDYEQEASVEDPTSQPKD